MHERVDTAASLPPAPGSQGWAECPLTCGALLLSVCPLSKVSRPRGVSGRPSQGSPGTPWLSPADPRGGRFFPARPSQTTSQTELENWITAIHSACAAAVARHRHKEDTLRLLKSEIRKLEQKIDMDEKMKKMGEMQLSSVTDSKKRKTILDQVIVRPCADGAGP